MSRDDNVRNSYRLGPHLRMASEVPTLVSPLDDEETPDRPVMGILYTDEQWEHIMREWKLRQRERAIENKRRGGLGMCSGIMWDEEI